MFVKPISRDIKGVVKVGQDEEAVIKQELEEYVVTNELQKHFRDFFASYKRGINNDTDKMGVWISGFFGSGKSHFLKILSYLLENREVDGRHAIDYFVEEGKINDPMVLADMKLASSIPTDTILFNIDSKSETAGEKDKSSLLNVFLKVFNEKLGYSANPHVAALERQLDEMGVYNDFQEKYLEITNEEWISGRNKFKFFKDRVVKTLVEIDFMSEETAQDWARSTVEPYQLSIYGFAEMINEYLDEQGEDHHLVFLVDEMGQYVGDNTDLMLNLQTITEDLGTLCQGRAWIVVTSQQDIDSITEVVGRDFSKIQGRFDTRLSLTSANVDEVIKLRILDKTDTANQTLAALYENKETIIKNLIVFNDGIEKKLYESKKDFSQVYPFIPYQFNILSSVLTSIRKYGASGKHLSEGERSMLALFKESAEKIKDEEHGTIVPFHTFYGALAQFLDHSHAVVISRALENNMINPDREEENFNVNVLKVLFMIKYVKEIEANAENITTLMVSNIDEDRIALKEKVDAALDILVKQTLVQKNGDDYVFLTDEEQEINREIESQDVETSEMTRKVSDLIFADIYADNRIQAPGKPQYVFGFNRFVDDQPYGARQNHDFGVRIITPYSALNGQESTLNMQSLEGNDVFIDLPNDAHFLEELRTEIKINKYLNSSVARNHQNFESIRANKGIEMRDHHDRGRLFLQEALKEANFYVNGNRLDVKGNNFINNLTESLERVIEIVYHKLDYITHPMGESDIHNLFKVDNSARLELEGVEGQNANAIRDVIDFIRLSTQSHAKVSLKAIKDQFLRAPWGFLETDIEWIIAKLFTDGLIGFTMNGKTVSRLSDSTDRIIDYITKNRHADKLLIDQQEIIPDRDKRILKTVSQELFSKNILTNDSEQMIMEFRQAVMNKKDELRNKLTHYQIASYPGKDIIDQGLELLNEFLQLEDQKSIFDHVKNEEAEYLDFADDYPQVKNFLDGQQKEIWDRSSELMSVFDDSKSYIVDEELESVVNEIKGIMKLYQPYNQISQLPNLNDQFVQIYYDLLDEKSQPVIQTIELEKKRVLDEITKYNFEDLFLASFKNQFKELMNRAKESNNIARIKGFEIEAKSLREKHFNEIRAEAKRRSEEIKNGKPGSDDEQEKPVIDIPPVPPIREVKYLKIRDVTSTTAWEIESQEDIDQYLEQLRANLEKELTENTTLTIDF